MSGDSDSMASHRWMKPHHVEDEKRTINRQKLTLYQTIVATSGHRSPIRPITSLNLSQPDYYNAYSQWMIITTSLSDENIGWQNNRCNIYRDQGCNIYRDQGCPLFVDFLRITYTCTCYYTTPLQTVTKSCIYWLKGSLAVQPPFILLL